MRLSKPSLLLVPLLLGYPSAHAQAPWAGSPRLGASHLDRFGQCVAAVGDLNNDQISDIAVGAPDRDSAGLTDNGSVFFYSGADFSVLLGSYDGTAQGERAGLSIAEVGDVNSDQVPDIAIGAPSFDDTGGNDHGRVLLVSGANFTLLASHTLADAGAAFGTSLAAAGDRDGDGICDLLVGAPFPGITVFSGSTLLLKVTASALTQIHRFEGSQVNEHFGHAVCSVPDVNADGYDEIAISAPDFDSGPASIGRVLLLSGKASSNYPQLHEWQGAELFEQIGWSLAAIGDPTGGSIPHLAYSTIGRTISGMNDAGGAKIVNAFSGALARTYEGDLANSKLGISLAAVDDQDGDGREDFMLGSPFASPNAQLFGGMVDLVSGFGDGTPTTPLTRLHRFSGVASQRIGESVAAMNDLNNDLCVEVAYGASGEEDLGGNEVGAVYLLRSNRPSLATDATQYFDLSPITITTQAFAGSLTFLMAGVGLSGLDDFMISFASPWAILGMPATNVDGISVAVGMFEDFGGAPLTLHLQVLATNPGGKLGNLLFSELRTVQVN